MVVKYRCLWGNYNMKKMRLPLAIAWCVAVIGIILGSFLDLQISKAIAQPGNGFALTISAIGPTIGFAAVAAMGGGFIALIVKGNYHIALKILFGVLALCCIGVAIYYPGMEYFGVNGFYKAAPEWVGYLIVLVPEGAAMFGGYVLFKNNQNKNIWIVFCIVIVVLLIALLLVIPNIKDNMHRPRYRLLSLYESNEEIYFHNWWEPTKNHVELISKYNVNKDDFKSFPSGHTAEASILLVGFTFLPLANKKFERYQLPLFLCGCGVVFLVALARILAGAHFLSDVSWGAVIVLTLTSLANEIVMRIKALQLPIEEEAK